MNKITKCKGTHKYTYGLGCNKEVNKKTRLYGLGKECGCQSDWLKTERASEYIKKRLIPKARLKVKKKKKEERKELREAKALIKDWSKELQDVVNKIVRYIDNCLPCLARNQRGQMHAGHVYARGGNQTIKYNLHNIHRQCAQSNHFQNDDGKLREGVINEYGQAYIDFISELRRTPAMNYNNIEYRELTYKAKSIYKELSKKERVFSKSERIEMRNRINLELGIYDKEFCEFSRYNY